MSEEVEGEAESPTLALVIALLIGLVVRSISSFIPQRWRVFPLPYTALILIIGVVIGIITQKTPGVAYASDSLRSLEGIAPTTLFTVFLPALMIPSGLSLHWHVVKRVLDKALLLAVFGTMFNAVCTALVFRFIFPYNWPWSGCFLLSAVLAATDPVAVVAIMHSVGASTKLATIIEGESLLNDGVAFVLFEIFRQWASGETLTAGGIVGFVFKASLGGPLLGLVWAAALTLWLAITFNDAILEITMSVVAGYALWIVSDEILGLSGMLSLVFFATALGAYGKSRISRSVTPSFDFFWSWVDWVANTLIFFVSGLITALELMKVSTISGTAWGWAVVLWLFLFIIRTAMVVLFYPVLRLGQYGTNWRDGIVLCWSGLRGAVGLTLALIIYYSDNVLDMAYREHFFFFTSFIAFITLVIQGSTTSLLLKALGFLKLKPAKKAAMIHAAGAVDRLGTAKINAAKKQPSLLGDAAWDKVKAYTKLDLAERVVKRSTAGGEFDTSSRTKKRSLLRRKNASLATEERKIKRSFVSDVRERFLQMVMALYKDAFAENVLSPDESLVLYESVEKSLDTIEDEGLSDWSYLEEKLTKIEEFEKELTRNQSSSSASSSSKMQMFWQKTKNFFYSPMRHARSDAEMVHGFVYAHAQARRELKLYLDIEFGVSIDPQQTHLEGDNNNNRSKDNDANNNIQDIHNLYSDDVETGYVPFSENSSKFVPMELAEGPEANGSGGGSGSGGKSIINESAPDLARSLSTIQRMDTGDKNQAINVQEALTQVLNESRTEQASAELHLQKLRELCPKAVQNLRTAHVSMQVLKKESEFLERLHAMGLLEEREVGPVLNQVERRIQRLNLADYESVPFLRPEPES